MYFVTTERILCGRYIHEYSYSNPKPVDFHKRPKPVNRGEFEAKTELSEKQKKYILAQKKRRFTRICECNEDVNRMITLTFGENVTDNAYCEYELEKFIKKLKRRLKDDHFKYIKIKEYQKRGAIHYHILVKSEYVDIKKIQQIWQNGFVFVQRINTEVVSYLAKYLTKAEYTPKGVRAFSRSRNCLKPKVVREYIGFEERVDTERIKEDSDVICSYEYKSDYIGFIEYTKRIMKEACYVKVGKSEKKRRDWQAQLPLELL